MASAVDVLTGAFTDAGNASSLGADSHGVCSLATMSIDAMTKPQQIEHIWSLYEQGKSNYEIAALTGWKYTKAQKLILILKKQKGVIKEALTKQQILEAKGWGLLDKDTASMLKKATVAPSVAPAITTAPVPLPTVATHLTKPKEWFDDLLRKKVGDAKGSNPGGVFVSPEGEKFYVKFYSDAAQGRGEHLANSIYKDLGLTAPDSVIGTASDGKFVYASRWMDDLKGTGQALGVSEDTAEKFLDGFVADVFTANWDAAGTGLDNLGVLKNGTVVRLDQGGTFLFRAKMGRKPTEVLDQITEWDTFFSSKNPYYKQVANAAGYKSAEDIGSARLIAQIDKVRNLVTNPNSVADWRAYVSRFAPTGTPQDEIQRIAQQMHAKAKLLNDKKLALQAISAPPKKFARPFDISQLPEAQAGDWPIGPSVTRQLGRNYPQTVESSYMSWVRTRLSVQERHAIESYTGSGYSYMNSSFRGGSPTEQARLVQSALQKAPKPPPPELVWRGIRDEGARAAIEKMARGDVITLEGLQSTSINPGFASSWGGSTGVLFEIRPIAGAYIRPISELKEEYEFLLPHGAKYRVRGQSTVSLSGVTRRVIQLEMLP